MLVSGRVFHKERIYSFPKKTPPQASQTFTIYSLQKRGGFPIFPGHKWTAFFEGLLSGGAKPSKNHGGVCRWWFRIKGGHVMNSFALTFGYATHGHHQPQKAPSSRGSPKAQKEYLESARGFGDSPWFFQQKQRQQNGDGGEGREWSCRTWHFFCWIFAWLIFSKVWHVCMDGCIYACM